MGQCCGCCCCCERPPPALAALDEHGWPSAWSVPPAWNDSATAPPLVAALKSSAVPLWMEALLVDGFDTPAGEEKLRAALTLVVAASLLHHGRQDPASEAQPGIVSPGRHDFKLFGFLAEDAIRDVEKHCGAAAISDFGGTGADLRKALSLPISADSNKMLTEGAIFGGAQPSPGGVESELARFLRLVSVCEMEGITSTSVLKSWIVGSFSDHVWQDGDLPRDEKKKSSDATSASEATPNPLQSTTAAAGDNRSLLLPKHFTKPDNVKRGADAAAAGYFMLLTQSSDSESASSASSSSVPATLSADELKQVQENLDQILAHAVEAMRKMNLRDPPMCLHAGCDKPCNTYCRPCMHAVMCMTHVHKLLQQPCPKCRVRITLHQYQPMMTIDQHWK